MGYTPPFLDVRSVSGGWNVYAPSNTTTDDLRIYANTVDTSGAYIKLNGNGTLELHATTASTIEIFQGSSTNILSINYATPDISLNGKVTDKNIFLNPLGTGVVKFGTYTAGAATDSTGYITILDAAGNTRKLMVQA